MIRGVNFSEPISCEEPQIEFTWNEDFTLTLEFVAVSSILILLTVFIQLVQNNVNESWNISSMSFEYFTRSEEFKQPNSELFETCPK